MKKQVFVLSSDGSDKYISMLDLASSTLRHHTPSAYQILVVDSLSHEKIVNLSAWLLRKFDEVIVRQCPSGTNAFRNRWMKTSIREFIVGDFVYLDADIVIRSDISALWQGDFDIGGVRENNVSEPVFSKYEAERFERLGWSLPAHGSINGGVLTWRDTKIARRLSLEYRQRWLESFEKTGHHYDQQALNKAINDVKARVCFFSNKYNAMTRIDPKKMSDACIWHFMDTGVRNLKVTNYWERAIYGDGKVPNPSDWGNLNQPWILDSIVKKLAFRSMLNDTKESVGYDPRMLWLNGRRDLAVWKLLPIRLRGLLSAFSNLYKTHVLSPRRKKRR